MKDIAHDETEFIIGQLDKKLNIVYLQATKEMEAKLNDYLSKSEAKDAVKLAEYKSGKITKKEYDTWKLGQVEIGKRWAELKETLATDMTNTNKIAAAMINGHKPGVYALNHNYATFNLEKDSLVDTSYTLYSHEAVENLVKKEPDLLPKNKIDVPKDKAWNKKKIDNAITQGILQGESLKDVSGRLKQVTDMNQNAAMRNARTAMTGAQNAGRIDAYERAKSLGIEVKKVWLATLDGRTRHSHALLDGETIDIDELFSNGLMFPGDPDGTPSEVYNCRCTLLGQPKGIDYNVSDLTRRNDKLGGMSYDAWKESHAYGLYMEAGAPSSVLYDTWSKYKMSKVYDLIKEQNVKDANAFYKELKGMGDKPSNVWAQYLNGELSDADVAKIEGILQKYLPSSTVTKIEKIVDTLDDHDAFLKSLQHVSIWSDQLDPDAFEYMHKKVGNGSISDFWNDYKAGKIKDEHLDELLGFKKVVKTADKIDDMSDVAKEAEAALKISKGNPMSMKEADDYKVNPLFDWDNTASTQNCQTSAFAYECRRQGYDVVAIPKDKSLVDSYGYQSKLGQSQTHGWINKKTGKEPEKLFHMPDSIGKTQSKKEIKEGLESVVGHNGERYTLSMRWKNGKAHVVNMERDADGVIRIIDNQLGKGEKNFWTLDEYLDKVSSGSKWDLKYVRYVTRVDDCVPNPEFFNAIVAPASKMKTDLPNKASAFGNYAKLNKHVKDNNLGKTSEYYTKWKYGLIDDDDLDDLLGYKKAADKVDDLADIKKAIPDNLVELASTNTDLYNKVQGKVANATPSNMTANEYWKKYLAGEIKNADIDDILKATKADDLAKKIDLPEFKKTLPKTTYGDLNPELFDKVDDYFSDTKGMGLKSSIDYWKKYVSGEIDDPDLDKILKSVAKTSEPTKSVTMVDLDQLKDKKVTAVYNELAEDDKSKANKFYNELKKIGQDKGYGKQGDVWKKYLAGELDPSDMAKIDSHLAKYAKAVEPIKPEVDLSALSKKKMSQVFNELKADNVSNANSFYKDLKNMGKPSEVWEKYLKGELSEDKQKVIDKYLVNKYQKGGVVKADINAIKKAIFNEPLTSIIDDTDDYVKFMQKAMSKGKSHDDYWKDYLTGKISDKELDDMLLKKYAHAFETPTTQVAAKSEDLIKAEKKLDKAEDALKAAKAELKDKVDNTQVWSGIWKDDVTLDDYAKKKDTIAAKKVYYKEEIEKIKTDPNYHSWLNLTQEEKDKMIAKYEKHLDDLDEYEKLGKYSEKYYDEIAKAEKAVEKAKVEVQKYSPSPFSTSYSKERKDAAKWPKSRQEADKLYMMHSQQEWDAAKPAERSAIKEYTQSYHKFNEPLRGIQYGTSQYKGIGKTDLNAGSAMNGKKLNAMTDYLDKCRSQHDQWLQRGCQFSGMDKFFGIDMDILKYGTEKELQDALLGKTVTEYGFMSAGTAKGKGFSGSILMNIFTPAGTKMSYAELYSYYKGGSEVETILQQGSQFIVTKVEKKSGQIYIDIELVNQLPPQRWVP